MEPITLNLRNILLFQLLVALTVAGSAPLVQQELVKIWKMLNTPLVPKKPAVADRKADRFWEIDMTKFEP